MTVRRRLVLGFPLAILLGALRGSAPAEVASVGDSGFTSKNSVAIAAPPAKVWDAFVLVSKWWDPGHTWSGDAANLTIDARPQGCFCEKLPAGGGVRHMTVVFASPGKLLRFEGGLGPFQALGVSGSLSWSIESAETGSSVTFQYAIGGYMPGGFKELAGGSDGVLRSQLERLKRFAETGKP